MASKREAPQHKTPIVPTEPIKAVGTYTREGPIVPTEEEMKAAILAAQKVETTPSRQKNRQAKSRVKKG